MSTTTYFGSAEAQAARSLIGGTAIGDTRNELLKQVLVAVANKTSGGGGAAWGAITGTLSNQTDLANALAAKLSLAGGTMTGDLTTKAAGLRIPGSVSGTATVQAPAVAGTPTITLPSVTSTLATLGANGFTAAQNITLGIAASTQADGVQLQNTTAATSGNQTWSPSLRLTGNQWSSGASRTCEALLTLVPVQQDFDHAILRFSTKHGANALVNVLDIRAFNQAPFIQPSVAGTALTIGGTGGNSSTNFQFNGSVVAQISTAFTFENGYNIATGTTTGTKIGTATTQKLGFWNATPVVQPAHIADPSGGAVIDAEARTAINAILAWQATLGLTAAS